MYLTYLPNGSADVIRTKNWHHMGVLPNEINSTRLRVERLTDVSYTGSSFQCFHTIPKTSLQHDCMLSHYRVAHTHTRAHSCIIYCIAISFDAGFCYYYFQWRGNRDQIVMEDSPYVTFVWEPGQTISEMCRNLKHYSQNISFCFWLSLWNKLILEEAKQIQLNFGAMNFDAYISWSFHRLSVVLIQGGNWICA